MTATVVSLSGRVSTACPSCEMPAAWTVNRRLRSCDRCLPAVLRHFYETDWDGFVPAVISPIRTSGGAA